MLQVQGQPLVRLVPTAENVFRVVEVNATLTFNERGGLVESIGLVQGPANLTLARVTADAAAPRRAAAAARLGTGAAVAAPIARPTGPRNWPSFRGDGSAGNGDGQRAVTEWDVATGKNIKWKTPIPGIATSSPIVWGNRIFVTTAISKAGDKTFRTGLYGDVKPVDDLSPHEWKIYSLDKATGKILWERTAFTGAPKTQAAHQEQPGQLHAGHRRPPRRGGVRIGGPAGRVGLSTARSCGASISARSTADGSSIPPSSGATPARRSSTATRSSCRPTCRRARISRPGIVATGKQLWKTARADEISTWGTPTIARTRRRPRRARHQRHQGPRLRSGHGQAAVDARAELGDHDRHAGRRQRPRLRDRRLSAGAADLRDPARRRAATSRCRRDRSRATRSRGAT